MASITVLGDGSTTTALAIASSWADDDVVLIEVDPTGGSLAAWLDVPITPSLSSIVAAIHRGRTSDERGGTGARDPWSIMDSMTRRAPGGLRFVPTPFTCREAERAVDEARSLLLPAITAAPAVTAILDLGRVRPAELPAHVGESDVCLVLHHQERSSPRAAAVRLERLAELVEHVQSARRGSDERGLVVGVIGDRPFDPDEIADHVGGESVAQVVTIADDPIAAAVLAGRTGVSARRLRRQPLLRDARRTAARLRAMLAVETSNERREARSITATSPHGTLR